MVGGGGGMVGGGGVGQWVVGVGWNGGGDGMVGGEVGGGLKRLVK